MVLERGQQQRILIACSCLVLLLSTLSARLIYLQFLRGDELSAKARSHYEYEEFLEAPRGRIFDRNGELLASTQIVYSMVVDFAHLRDPGLASIGLGKKEGVAPGDLRLSCAPGELRDRYLEYVVETLAGLTRLSPVDLRAKMKSRESGELILARKIEDDFRRQLEKELREHRIGGIYLRKSHRRFYPSPSSLTHVIGFVGSDQKGREGVEKVFDREMTGEPGFRVCERDRHRREIHAYRQSNVEAVPGKDIHLTIDMALQTEVEIQVDKLMTMYSPEKLTTIWMRPATGEVLALANRPHFDLETRRGQRRNIAVTDVYEPGSTFKMVTFGAAFDQGVIEPSSLIDCHNGEYDEEGFVMKDHARFGVLPAEMVLAKSSNIGAYRAVHPIGERAFHQYMVDFGFGAKTGIGLTAENSGAIYPVEQWNQTSFSSKAIGYEVLVTPLQMAAACGVVANRGIYRSPVLVSGVSRGKGEPIEPAIPGAERRVLSEEAADDLRRCMVTALQLGTGRRAGIPGYTVAGKTGTARKHVENVGYADGRYVVSFVGFLPSEDPELLGLIVIDDPKSNDLDLYGGTVAAPAFRSIAQEAVKILGIQPDVPEELTSRPERSNLTASREE